MRIRLLALFAVAFAIGGCNGPKDTCEGSFQSYYALLQKHDWQATYEMLTPEFKKKLQAARYAKGMEDEWVGTKSFSQKVFNVAVSGKLCIVNGTMDYTIKIRGKEPQSIKDDYFSWTFRQQSDGKWYIDMPGMEKVGGF